jgi:hypothetical protein
MEWTMSARASTSASFSEASAASAIQALASTNKGNVRMSAQRFKGFIGIDLESK